MHRWLHRVALTAIAFITGQTVLAQAPVYSDDEIKAQFVKARTFCNAEFITGSYRLAFEMAGNDTNRYVRVLSELAAENTNQTRSVINQFFCRRLPASIPFLYSYATNATYGAEALKAILAIEGVTSNSLAAAQCYLSLTNDSVLVERGGAIVCGELVRCSMQGNINECCRTNALDVAYTFAMTANKNYYWLDKLMKDYDPSYRYSRRRLSVLRSFSSSCPYEFQINYVTNAINELVAYPEANLPE